MLRLIRFVELFFYRGLGCEIRRSHYEENIASKSPLCTSHIKEKDEIGTHLNL